MFNSKSKTARKEVEAIFNEIQINLENNYSLVYYDSRMFGTFTGISILSPLGISQRM